MSDSPEVVCYHAWEKFEEFGNSSVFPILQILDQMYNKPRRFSENYLWQYWQHPQHTYENDGATQCPGTSFEALCSVGIARPINDRWTEKHEWECGKTHSVMNFHTQVSVRNSDQRVFWTSCELTVSPYLVDEDKKQNSTRISHTTCHWTLKCHKSESKMLKLLAIIEENFKMEKLHRKLEGVLNNLRQEERDSQPFVIS